MRLRAKINRFKSAFGAILTNLFKWSDVPGAYFGYYTIAGNLTRLNGNRSGLAVRVRGTKAEMYCWGGSSTPYLVTVDGVDYSGATLPTYASGKITLFDGLPDEWHTVFINANVWDGGQGVENTSTLFSAVGSNPQVVPLGAAYLTGAADFPGVFTGFIGTAAGAHSYHPSTAYIPSSNVGWGQRNTSSIHFRGKFEEIYVNCSGTIAYVSIDGGPMQRVDLSAQPAQFIYGQHVWKRLTGITGSLSTYKNVIISGCGSTINNADISGVLLSGTGAVMAAPSGTKRHCLLFGASQVEGAGANSAAVDIHIAQPYLPIYACSSGWSGQTTAAGVTGLPTLAAKMAYKDIIEIGIGFNGNSVADYKALIQAALTAGFNRVICRTPYSNQDNSGNATIISQAVTETADPRVVFASTATWTVTTTGAGGTIKAPDGVHPDEAGYVTIADFSVRDHASLFV